MRLFALSLELTVCTREHPDYTSPLRRDGSEHREMIVDFPMDAVAGARQTPGRLKTGGVPPKPPARNRSLSVAQARPVLAVCAGSETTCSF